MPAMRAKLDPNDVVKLVALVRRFRGGQWVVPEEETEPQETSPHRPAPREATRVAAPAPSRRDLPLDPGAGTVAGHVERAIFQRSCQICHGADGRGAPSGSRLPGIPDFTSRAWQEGRSQAQLEASILEGKGERMPAFRDKLGAEQVSALAAFVRAFGPPQARPPSAPSGDFDDRLTRLQREFEELRRVYRKLSPPPPSGADPDTIE
jgi:mono/diheme cytochrome c family protein